MPNFKKHITTGLVGGAVLAALTNIYLQTQIKHQEENNKFDWPNFITFVLAGASAGGIAAILPDLLEPASHPNHRKLFHSVATGSLIVSGLFKANSICSNNETKLLLNSGGLGYLSHILLDSQTPFGIPLVA